MKVYSVDVLLQEIPNEISLSFLITGCRNSCPNCHSPHLHSNIGDNINMQTFKEIILEYKDSITNVLFLGGEHLQNELSLYCSYVRSIGLKTAWYSGDDFFSKNESLINSLNYYKIGRYDESKGGLSSPNTNQRLYEKKNNEWIDITYKLIKRHNR